MRFNRLLLTTLTFGLMACPATQAQAPAPDVPKRAQIEQLLEVTNAKVNARAMMNSITQQMLQMQKQKQPSMTQEQSTAITEAVAGAFEAHYGSFHQMMVFLYDKHYSATDIQQLLAFFSSDTGKKLIQIQPRFQAESVEAGAQWGNILQPEIQRRIQERLASPSKPL